MAHNPNSIKIIGCLFPWTSPIDQNHIPATQNRIPPINASHAFHKGVSFSEFFLAILCFSLEIEDEDCFEDGVIGEFGSKFVAGGGAGHPQLGHLWSVAGYRLPHAWHSIKAAIIHLFIPAGPTSVLYKKKRKPVSLIRLRGSGMPMTRMKQNGSRFYDIWGFI